MLSYEENFILLIVSVIECMKSRKILISVLYNLEFN